MEWDSAVVGIVRNVYNWLSYGIVGNSVCRTWESCTLAFPCAVNRVIRIPRSIMLITPEETRSPAHAEAGRPD